MKNYLLHVPKSYSWARVMGNSQGMSQHKGRGSFRSHLSTRGLMMDRCAKSLGTRPITEGRSEFGRML